MSVLIILSSAFPGEERTELEAFGEDARRLAAIVDLPGAVKVIRANVTFFYEALDVDAKIEEIQRSRADSERELSEDQLTFPQEFRR